MKRILFYSEPWTDHFLLVRAFKGGSLILVELVPREDWEGREQIQRTQWQLIQKKAPPGVRPKVSRKTTENDYERI